MKILKPKIFPKNIISGVTKRNLSLFPPFGFNLKNSDHREKLAEYLGVNQNSLIIQAQSHSDTISIADFNKANKSDAIITNKENLILNVSIADCAAILLYDPKNKVIAGVHSGWRGTKKEILPKTINTLINKYVSNPKDLCLYFSPMASVERYEVGEEFAEFFPNSVNKQNNNFYFDNLKQILLDIEEFDIPAKNIEIANVCTISNIEYHSFRRDADKSGRMSAFIGMI